MSAACSLAVLVAATMTMSLMADRGVVLPDAGRREMLRRAHVSVVRDPIAPAHRGAVKSKRKGQGRRRRARRISL